MGRIADEIADALVTEVRHRREWDEPPALCFLYVKGGRAGIREVPLPDVIWSAGRPPLILARLAAVSGSEPVSSLLRNAAPEDLYGAAFRCEAWEVIGGEPGTADWSETMADAQAHRLHLRADRREIRSIFAVDRAGVTYIAVQGRGDDDVRRSIAYPKPGAGFTGTIPASLDRIVTAVLGVSLPSRRLQTPRSARNSGTGAGRPHAGCGRVNQ